MEYSRQIDRLANLANTTFIIVVFVGALCLTANQAALAAPCSPPDPCEGKTCNDYNPCTDDECVEGSCQNTNNNGNSCTDGNPCTDDACVDGSCEGTNNNSNSCDDGNPCTDDACVDGACEGAPKDCDDSNPCTDDSCEAGTGNCQHTNNNSNPCDDGNPCTDDACVDGECQGTPDDENSCDDGNPCTDDECVDGNCQGTPDDENSCDDGLYCTGTETCGSGSCNHSGDPCPGPDGDDDCSETCNESADDCSANDPDDSACDDDVYCNGNDTCSAGSCSNHSGDPCDGPDYDSDCSETCNESADDCSTNDPDGSQCDDGNFCTDDECSSGICVSTPRNCDTDTELASNWSWSTFGASFDCPRECDTEEEAGTEDACSHHLWIRCGPPAPCGYKFYYDTTVVGACIWHNGWNCFQYRKTQCGKRFHSTRHTTLHRCNSNCAEGCASLGYYCWKVKYYNCINEQVTGTYCRRSQSYPSPPEEMAWEDDGGPDPNPH